MLDGHPRPFVAEGVDQDWHVERRPAQRIGDRTLVAEVRQRYQHAIDVVAVPAKQVGARPRVRETLHRTVRRRRRVERHDVESLLSERLQYLLPAGRAEIRGKEPAVSHDDAQGRRALGHGGHSRYHGAPRLAHRERFRKKT